MKNKKTTMHEMVELFKVAQTESLTKHNEPEDIVESVKCLSYVVIGLHDMVDDETIKDEDMMEYVLKDLTDNEQPWSEFWYNEEIFVVQIERIMEPELAHRYWSEMMNLLRCHWDEIVRDDLGRDPEEWADFMDDLFEFGWDEWEYSLNEYVRDNYPHGDWPEEDVKESVIEMLKQSSIYE